ncbi:MULTISPECIES: hypothetical protein [Pseudomonas]|uniref:hypothetical protein n=2 Tax=Pseudomonas TaxID=286 RepID=UPI0012FE5F99|nr:MULTISPECIES: hypothetical protein [Pseudomonas]EKT9146097.1 hypothetical protein [Pseudomonas aeruginosa]EKW2382634.1 hypothetical protein [Pseudomonas aeruginosa]EKW9874589.1 hypothetical protein [Pseudomonas aeruginosa]EKY4118281.1 hypothetical protein [Pseudomonas aeruginosa]ELB6505951.1 hypothetical protein [Pseudomonas aeruginosa]
MDIVRSYIQLPGRVCHQLVHSNLEMLNYIPALRVKDGFVDDVELSILVCSSPHRLRDVAAQFTDHPLEIAKLLGMRTWVVEVGVNDPFIAVLLARRRLREND